MDNTDAPDQNDAPGHTGIHNVLVYRHPVIVRLAHWIGAVCVAILLVSGLQIFNARPDIYRGHASDFADPVVAIGSKSEHGRQVGMTTILGHSFNTTGFLGLSGQSDNDARAFPSWATLPYYQDLATGRRWHFFFAWLLLFDGLFYLIYTVSTGRVWRELVPSKRQLRHVGKSIVDHMLLRFPRGEKARHYNVLQRLAYLFIAFVALPLMILTGVTMSPGLDAAFPFLTSVFGGRQTARTIHFIGAFTVVGFVIVHVAMVVLSGPWNNMRSMITGWYAIKPARKTHGETV
ncbi:MAG: cytochrome b/b6 domain-containing protein [Xanthobacteraceae bacterium]